MFVTLEIAVDNTADALAASARGVDRLELCTDLASHGLSADGAVVREIKRASAIPVMALVRSALGGFVYSDAEFSTHLHDAEGLLAAGADGIVFGSLHADLTIQRAHCREMVRLCGTGKTVFHRAFDLAPDPLAASDELADLGVTRILTAGMEPREAAAALGVGPIMSGAPAASPAIAPDLSARLARLARLVGHAAGRIEIVACGGVRTVNAMNFVVAGCTQIHSACRSGTARLNTRSLDELVGVVRVFGP